MFQVNYYMISASKDPQKKSWDIYPEQQLMMRIFPILVVIPVC